MGGAVGNILGSILSSIMPFSKGGTIQTKDGLYKVSVVAHSRGMPRKIKTVRGPDTMDKMISKKKVKSIASKKITDYFTKK